MQSLKYYAKDLVSIAFIMALVALAAGFVVNFPEASSSQKQKLSKNIINSFEHEKSDTGATPQIDLDKLPKELIQVLPLFTPVRQTFISSAQQEEIDQHPAPLPMTQRFKESLDANFQELFSKTVALFSGTKKVIYQVERGDTFTKILQNQGASPEVAHKITLAFLDSGVSAAGLSIKEELEFEVTPFGNILSFTRHMNDGRTLTISRNEHREYVPNLVQHEIKTTEKTYGGAITASFAEAAYKQNIPADVIDEIADLLGSRIEFRKDIQIGDTFSVIYDEKEATNGVKLGAGPIKAVSFNVKGKNIAAIRHVGKDGKARYFNELGEASGDGFLRYPVKFTRISSAFSYSRFHPILKVSRPHNGVDFAAPSGTPVRSVADGVVEFAGWSKGGGYTVRVAHSPRYTTVYMHLSKIVARQGTKVSRSDVIGNVGATGLATAPHLHFSFYDSGKYVDPLKIALPALARKEDMIPQDYLKQVIAKLSEVQELTKIAWLRNSQNLKALS